MYNCIMPPAHLSACRLFAGCPPMAERSKPLIRPFPHPYFFLLTGCFLPDSARSSLQLAPAIEKLPQL